jgi:hypothetical protein
MPENTNRHNHPPDGEAQFNTTLSTMYVRASASSIPHSEEPMEQPELEPNFVCDYCGTMHLGEPEINRGNFSLCEGCVTQGANVCEGCEEHITSPFSRYTAPSGERLCSYCFSESYTSCHGCHEIFEWDDVEDFSNMRLCRSCWNDGEGSWQTCEGCEGVYYFDELRERGAHGLMCASCARELGPIRDVSYEVDGEARSTRSFGVEIEVEFGMDEADVPWELGYYHSGEPAPDCFYSGWRGEYDGSLDGGGEFISPPLEGAGGLAEIINTFRTLEWEDAEIRNTCGQHISVGVGAYHRQVLVQRLSLALEEALFATTGAYGRMTRNSYAERLKDEAGDYIRGGNAYGSRTCICGLRDWNGTVEFRYPPGTLVAAQGAINVGLTQLVVQLVFEFLSEDEIDELVERSMELELDQGISRHERVHAQVMLGLRLFCDVGGWAKGGDFLGMPYDPAKPATVTVRDAYHTYANRSAVTLPSEEEILRRLERQISNFYRRMGAKPEQLVEALGMFGIATPVSA